MGPAVGDHGYYYLPYQYLTSQFSYRRLLDGAQRQRAIGSRGRSRFRRHPAVSGIADGATDLFAPAQAAIFTVRHGKRYQAIVT